MLELSRLDLDEIATALSDQSDYDHQWLIDPRSGQTFFWTSNTGIDGQNPIDLEDLDLTPIDPIPSHVWYQDMADFAERLSDDAAGRRLTRAIQGKGAFRRFKNELHEDFPKLLPTWHVFRDDRATRRAVEWLADEGLIVQDNADQYRQRPPRPRPALTAAPVSALGERTHLPPSVTWPTGLGRPGVRIRAGSQ